LTLKEGCEFLGFKCVGLREKQAVDYLNLGKLSAFARQKIVKTKKRYESCTKIQAVPRSKHSLSGL
jgi:hypothetical protein